MRGFDSLVKMSRGKYYYDFLNTVEKLRKKDDSCFICGSTKRVKPHHIVRVKDSDKRYASPGNVVLLCSKHHHLYHQCYGSGKGVNNRTFLEFCKKEYLKEIKSLRKEKQLLMESVEDTGKYAVEGLNE